MSKAPLKKNVDLETLRRQVDGKVGEMPKHIDPTSDVGRLFVTLDMYDQWCQKIGLSPDELGSFTPSSVSVETMEQRFKEVSINDQERTTRVMWGLGQGAQWHISPNGSYTFNRCDKGATFQYPRHNGVPTYTAPLTWPDGMPMYHAHVIPALMINQLLANIATFPGNATNTYVLCQGNRVPPDEQWWMDDAVGMCDNKIAARIVDFLTISDAFKNILPEMYKFGIRGRRKITLNRLVVWLKVTHHVFSLVWEVYLSDRYMKSVCYCIDALGITSINAAVLGMFIKYLNEMPNRGVLTAGLDGGIGKMVDQDDVPIDRTHSFLCVSFMARCTLYLSMVNSGKHQKSIVSFHKAAGLKYERVSYDQFNQALLAFLTEMDKEERVVWISPINDYFVDALQIHLVAVSVDYEDMEVHYDKYAYYGPERGFMPYTPSETPGSCAMQSQYPPLTLVRDCRSTLERLRLR